MKVSIITATYNSENTVSESIMSVNEQTYSNIEHIIIDGASKDRTLDIINSLSNRNIKIVSEKDKGIYDALNKGISLATGDIIGFLHSDDTFKNNDTIAKVVNSFQEGGKLFGIYGDLHLVNHTSGKVIRHWKSKQFDKNDINRGWMCPHPTLFLSKGIYHRYPKFNLDYKIAGDYDYIVRILKDKEIELKYIPTVITTMKYGGASTGGLKSIIKKSSEDFDIIKKHKLGFPLFTLIMKNLSKLSQFLR